jgi:hypothetical protein
MFFGITVALNRHRRATVVEDRRDRSEHHEYRRPVADAEQENRDRKPRWRTFGPIFPGYDNNGDYPARSGG